MQAITDMLGGTIQLNIGTTATLLPLIREGKIRAIAQWGKKREADLPDVPTMIESGFPGLSLGFWVGLWAPAGTPRADRRPAQPRRQRRAALGRDDARSMARLGVAPSPARCRISPHFIADEAPKWADIVKASGTQID